MAKKGVLELHQMKRAGEKITWLTAYDYPTATFEEAAGVDMILVGDSLGMCVYGYPAPCPSPWTSASCTPRRCAAARRTPSFSATCPSAATRSPTRRRCATPAASSRRRTVDAIKLEGGVASGHPRQGDPRRRHRGLRPHRPHAAELGSARRPQGPGAHARVGQACGRMTPAPYTRLASS